MLIYENGGWQTSSESADTNYLEGIEGCTQPKWVVPDSSEVAAKVVSAVRPWEPVEDENGNLIDITETPLSQVEIDQQRIDEIKQQLTELDAQAVRPPAPSNCGRHGYRRGYGQAPRNRSESGGASCGAGGFGRR